MANETVLVLDFGGQYSQLIARRVREQHVYCEVHPHAMPLAEVRARRPKGIILTGGPRSVYGPGSLPCDAGLFALGVPVLGICYGAQLMAHALGGSVAKAPAGEYGHAAVRVDVPDSALLAGVPTPTTAWMSHADRIESPPPGFRVTASTDDCPVAAMEDAGRGLYAVQFHPEVSHTAEGARVLGNFLRGVCRCTGDWRLDSFVADTVASLRDRVGDGRALCALSGGVDSSVAAALMAKAIGKRLACVFVDHGLLRKGEGDEVAAAFGPGGPYDLTFVRVDAADRFLGRLAGVSDPERKRRVIGEEFIRVFEEQSRRLGAVDFLVQGTIYPDVIESGLGESAVIKSHHNVGALPDSIGFRAILEPLRMLFKDEVRAVGRELGIPERLVRRQPFPGPGLAIRVLGEVTADKLRIVREADAIYREEVDRAGVPCLGQYFAALTDLRSVGVMGDGRTYDRAVLLRAVRTGDFMTAESAALPWEVLRRATARIVNEVPGVNRVLYDCTDKPPATIELE